MCDWKFSTDCGLGGIRRRLGLPARRRELGCRLLFWRCPSHFVESPWKREDRHCSSSSSAIGPGDFLRSETCPPQPGSSDPSRDALVTVMWEMKERNVLPLLTKIKEFVYCEHSSEQHGRHQNLRVKNSLKMGKKGIYWEKSRAPQIMSVCNAK